MLIVAFDIQLNEYQKGYDFLFTFTIMGHLDVLHSLYAQYYLE